MQLLVVNAHQAATAKSNSRAECRHFRHKFSSLAHFKNMQFSVILQLVPYVLRQLHTARRVCFWVMQHGSLCTASVLSILNVGRIILLTPRKLRTRHPGVLENLRYAVWKLIYRAVYVGLRNAVRMERSLVRLKKVSLTSALR